MEADGYSLDDKRTFIDGKGDIPDVIEHFRIRRDENPTDRKKNFFFIPFDEIKENGFDLTVSRYKEIEYQEVQYEKPDIILQRIGEMEDEIRKKVDELKLLLKEQ